MLNFNEFVNKVNENSSNRKVFSFRDWQGLNPKMKEYIKSIDPNIKDNDERALIEMYNKFNQFKEEADYLKKEQKYYQMFFRFYINEEINHQELSDLYKSIQKHKNTLSQQKVDLTNLNTSEEVYDTLDRMKLIEKTNKFIKLIPNPLRNRIKSDYDFIQSLSEYIQEYSYEDYKNVFMKKVARIKNEEPKVFFELLQKHIDSFAPKSELYKRVEDHPGAEVVASSDDYLVARIYSKKASCDLGSSQWCISNQSYNYWDSYVVNKQNIGPGVQYFVWDFRYGSTDIKSQVGITKYRGIYSGYGSSKNKTYVAHLKNDSSTTIEGKPWEKFITSWDTLSQKQKVRLIADNHKIESYTGVLNQLGEKEKRKLLQDVPKLLTQFKDLSFLTNQEIWTLVQKDRDLCNTEAIARELNDDQKIISVVKDPDLLEKKWSNNPYHDIKNKLTRNQRVEMVSNKHSLFKQFDDLTSSEILNIIKLDPTIMVSYPSIPQKVDQKELKDIYLNNKKKWDNKISSVSNKENSSKVEILLNHLTKDVSRLEMEKQNICFVHLSKKENIDGQEWLLPSEKEGLLMVEDILDPQNEGVINIMLMAEFDPDFEGYFSWVPSKFVDKEKMKNDVYYFENDYISLIKSDDGSDELEIIKAIQKNHKLL